MEDIQVEDETQNITEEQKIIEQKIREELLDLASKGEIRYKEDYIKKAKNSTLEKIYADYQRQQLRETNEMLTDGLISKFSELMERLDMIKSAESTGKKLQEKKLLRRDLIKVFNYVTPIIPYVGFLEGGMSFAGDVINHKFIEKQEETPSFKKEED